MITSFFKAFPTLKLNKECKDIFEMVEIEKIVTNTRKDSLRIYIVCTKLIFREIIEKVQKEIEKQLFPTVSIQVLFQEKYHLSEQYNAEKLMHVYKDSILMELKTISQVQYILFNEAKITFPTSESILLMMQKNSIAETYSNELIRILEKIFVERCNINVIFTITYQEEIKNKGPAIKGLASQGPAAPKSVSQRLVTQESATQESATQESATQESATQKSASQEIIEIKEQQIERAGSINSSAAATKKAIKKQYERKEYKGNYKSKATSDNPDVFFGKDFEEEAMLIVDIEGEMGEVVVQGKILRVDTRDIKNEKMLIIFDISDATDTITIKMFSKNEQANDILLFVKVNEYIKLKGVTMIDKYDGELSIGSVISGKKIKNNKLERMDHAIKKRVELHCHTKMSDMDGVSNASAIIEKANAWGMAAIAITDHGNVQAFPDAFHTLQKLDNADFKVLYGVEAYIVDDLEKIVVGDNERSFAESFVVFDLETTGLSPINDRIIEIGAVKIKDGQVVDHFSTFVNPDTPISFKIEKITGINDDMVLDAPKIEAVFEKFMDFCSGCVLVAHNAPFDTGFIMENSKRLKMPFLFSSVDTLGISRLLYPKNGKHTLDAIAKIMGVSLINHHRAVDDANATAQIFIKMIPILKEMGAKNIGEINMLANMSPEVIAKLPSYHAIIFAENEVGRINLYRLISASHLTYYNKRPKMPKSLILKHKEGLIIGSACEAGEVYRGLIEGKTDTEIARRVRFYDYLEIQPVGNNLFMIDSERYEKIQSKEDIQSLNKQVVKLGELFKKPVVATCDVHFLNPEDEIYRRIIMAGRGFADCDDQPPLYLRTTEEMLLEFSYLGAKKAEEVVITNTNLIADRIEKIEPVRPGKYPPTIAESDKLLTEICYRKAHELYGDDLPPFVEERLKKELNSIIKHGFAVMYIIAQKLVWKSIEDGYLVGSRGSVGSSFVATMAGITEVNPLPPHYYCSHCHYTDFSSEKVQAFLGMAGIDMPDQLCPVCGEKLKKDGFDIPFETFLGFKGDKEPDIDLNFSGEYQSKAHRYTEVIFGAGQTFRAGTIGTLADKTAYGYVKNYYEERGIRKRSCEINRIVQGCTGVRRTTGQHPGGIIVLPLGQEIDSFTPVQHPANDMSTDIITTHFDYHSIDHNLLKLDILGHDDPTMIRMLQDLTGIDPLQIPLDDEKVMSIFRSTDALGITPDQIGGCKLGSLGIPEFGTDFVIQMLLDTKPKTFSDLVRISGLSHGTDVWVGNAQTLIQDGNATISTAICTRDDIMSYLIHMGVESSLSFTIMESVRKGKGLQEEWVAIMQEQGVPDWYIWSCKKIQYMFPKAHAAAYVMMAWRIAYCKVNYPVEYYAAYFSIRASAFSYEVMCQGKKHLEHTMADFEQRKDSLTKKELDMVKDMKIVQEMYARGIEFTPIDVFMANPRTFQIIEGKIMPSLNSIDGLGEKAAIAIALSALQGPFLSKDDFRFRTKASKTVVDLMDKLHLLGNIPESNQLSLFDL